MHAIRYCCEIYIWRFCLDNKKLTRTMKKCLYFPDLYNLSLYGLSSLSMPTDFMKVAESIILTKKSLFLIVYQWNII